MKFGLIGRTLKHSYSKIIHEMFGEYQYDLVSMEEEEISGFVKNPEYRGFNITIPYKKTIMPYCESISSEAKKIGSVNTVIKKGGKLFGYNTDYSGFSAMAKRGGIEFFNKTVAILGSGGTYNTAYAVVKDSGAKEVISVSRNGKFNYDNIADWNSSQIIINTTPVGMYPNNGESIINLDDFKNLEGVIDVIYNPLKTKLVFEAEKRGLKAIGGLYMLVFQAKEAFEIFTGKKISDDKTEDIYNTLIGSMQNMVFIGMPGSGKSTAGEFLSQFYNKELLDIDDLIVKKANMSIPEIFEKFGEDYFRDLETECVKEAGRLTGKIISCGGGIIKREENLYHLAQNGKICWIKRDLKNLKTEGRPLSSDYEALVRMEQERTPKYQAFADRIIENTQDLDSFYEELKKL